MKYVGFTNNHQQKPLFIWMFWSGRSPWKLSVSKLYLKVKFSFKNLFAVWFTKGWLHRWIPKIDTYKFCGIYHVFADAHVLIMNHYITWKVFVIMTMGDGAENKTGFRSLRRVLDGFEKAGFVCRGWHPPHLVQQKNALYHSWNIEHFPNSKLNQVLWLENWIQLQYDNSGS